MALAALRASTFEVALLTAVAWLPWLLVGLPAGAWVDRLPKRPVMAVCNTVSMVVFASAPLAQLAGLLSMPYLLVVALAGGTAKVFFSVANRSYVPALVDREQLLAANTRLQGSESAAQVGGPRLAGVLAGVFGPVSGILADAVSFGFSALCLRAIRLREGSPAAGSRVRLRTQVADGLRFVTGDRYLRVLVAFGAVSNLALNGYASIQVVVGSNVVAGTFRQGYCPPGLFGRITACSAVVNYGAIPLGGLLGGILGQTLGLRETMFVMGAVQPAALAIPVFSPLRPLRDFPQRQGEHDPV